MKQWQDLGGDRWKLTILPDDPEDQTPPSVYRGTKPEIADLLAESQGNANRRITELKRKSNGSSNGPVPLTDEQRLQTVAELNNPATVDRAVTRVIESVMGPVEDQRARQEREELDRQIATALSFADETPEWHDSEFNKNTLVRYMQSQGMSLSNRSHYTRAFEELSAAKLLQAKPSEAETETEPEEDERERNAPVPAPVPAPPRRVSTGVMQKDISGSPPRPTTRLKYTREQIADLSAQEYKRLMMADTEFTRCVEYYAQQDRQQRRRTG